MKIEANFNNKIYFAKKKSVKNEKTFFQDNKAKMAVGGTFITSGAILASISAVKKSQEVNRLKQELIRAYDLIYEDMAQEAQAQGIKFVKPKLIFKPLNKKMQAWYVSGVNVIEVNTKILEPKSTLRYNNNTYLVEKLDDGVEIPCMDFTYGFFAKREKNSTYIEGDEKLYMLAGILKHELTHARQEQFMLCSKDGLKKLYLMLKNKYPNEYKKVNFERFKRILPFYTEYKPEKIFDKDEKITFEYPNVFDKNGDVLQISYKLSDIVGLKADYSFDNSTKYYADLMEIEARAEQAEFYKNYKKYLPNITISDDIISYYFRCLQYICQIMLNKS